MSYSWGAGLASAMTDGMPVVRQAAADRQPFDRQPLGPQPFDPQPFDPQPFDRQPSDRRGADLRRLAAELAPMVEVWQRLLHLHVPDGVGRCRTCTKGGTGLPSISWPCSLHGVADLARRCHAGEPC